MGQYATHINYFGITFDEPENLRYDEISEACERDGCPFELDTIGEFDNANLAIHNSVWLLYFKKYTADNWNQGVNGDVTGIPSDAEVQKMKAFCEKYDLPFSEPSRGTNTYID